MLLLALVVTAAWALGVTRRRHARRDWTRTQEVALVIVQHGPVPARTLAALTARTGALEERLAAEMTRHGRSGPQPFALTPLGPADAPAPPVVGTGEGLAARAEDWWALRKWRRPVDAAVGGTDRFDLVVYVVVHAASRGDARLAEGFGARGGEVGLVETTIDDRSVDFALVAVGHELLHLLGATDKYDAAGHAAAGGLVEPALGLPQRLAEIMVGEIPLAPGSGRVAARLEEVGVGPVTAAEIGWAAAAQSPTP